MRKVELSFIKFSSLLKRTQLENSYSVGFGLFSKFIYLCLPDSVLLLFFSMFCCQKLVGFVEYMLNFKGFIESTHTHTHTNPFGIALERLPDSKLDKIKKATSRSYNTCLLGVFCFWSHLSRHLYTHTHTATKNNNKKQQAPPPTT